ncbi:AsmA-like C-terminal region-containing protein [Pontibacter silvestris]|uniref:AsmA-like C-terminal region-containing protein n=1 Tax=Pontibacter silvestris TaxID=2305183 RepID=A0ABW4X0P4_9BACT|nr:AsmA-like C-terminal region-containing protein [Pontibacter silvestris]MCC9135684.1 AsmA family protein [Pontibacter silvestris]
MKKVVIGFFIFLALLLVIAAVVPVLFKDKIKQALDKEITKNINAIVIYETDDVSLSLFRDFPNLSLGVDNLSVIGKDSFQTDTLAQIPSFRLGLNLASVFGDKLKVNSIALNEPTIRLIVLKSGKANWDIFIEDTTATTSADTAASEFNMAIKGWEINNGTFFYDDLTIPFGIAAYNVNHTGSGDFEKSVFDMDSRTTADRFTMTYAGANYIENAKLNADVTLAMDLEKSLYTFKDNNIRINEFPFQFSGTILLPDADYMDYDLTFKATETDFRNVLSIVPGMYSEQFEDIKTEGKLSFDGFFKGRMTDSLMPSYGVDLKIIEGMFKYPDLPEAAHNINVDMSVASQDGTPAATNVNVRQFHLDLGKNPVDAKVVVNGLEPMQVDGNVKANVDLAEITKVFPVEGMTLRGLLKVDADAKGTYSETSMPVVNADMRLTNGYVKSADFPAPIQSLNVIANILNTTGNTDDTRINIQNFNMTLDGEPLEGRVLVQGIDQPAFDANVKGILDLTKLTKIFPLDNMTVSGRINANIAAKGKVSDIEAERYNNVTANGSMAVNNLNFVSTDLPQGIKIDKANAVFNNERIELQNMSGYLGKSDIQASGTISNYLGYALAENQSLRGNFNLSSNKFNVNEWMVDQNTGESVSASQEAEGVVEVPANLDVTLNIDAKQVVYNNLNLNNVSGRVLVKDQVARLQQVSFNTLGGTFATSGSYNTQNLQQPLFDVNLDIKNLKFKEAFNAFSTIKTLAPIAGLLEGTFSTKFNFAGELGQDMAPVFKTLDGQGIIDVVRAAVSDVKIVDKISSLTNFEELKNFVVEGKRLEAEIVNGSLVVKPFDLNIGNIDMTVGGSNNVNGQIDYVTALKVPAGKVGRELNTRLASLLGNDQLQNSERITLNLNIGGTLSDPRVALAGGSVKEQATEVVKNVVQDKLNNAKAQAEQRKQQLQDSVTAELNRRKEAAEQKAREELEKKRKEAEQEVKGKATDLLKGLLKPKSNTQPDTTKTGN